VLALLGQVQEVRVVEVSGPAMDAAKVAFVAGLAFGMVTVIVVVAIFAVLAWRGG